MQNVTDLKAAAQLFKTGYTQKSTYKVDSTKSQRLTAPEKCLLIKTVSEHLTNHMATICPISGLTMVVDFPALPGFYMEAYHPIVHNIRSIIKNPDYCTSLAVEQKAGLILAALNFYKLLSTTTPALTLNMAMVANIPTVLLDTIIKFIADSAAVTTKRYPVLVVDASVSANGIQQWMHACDEVEHFDYNPVTLESLPTHEQKLFKVPKLISTEKQVKMYDKECLNLWEEVVDTDILPKDFIKKAKPLVSQLVSNPSGNIIERMLTAMDTKLSAYLEDAALTDSAEDIANAESIVNEFMDTVRAKRASADRLGLYANLHEDNLFTDSATVASSSVSNSLEVELAHCVEQTTEVVVEKPKSIFEQRLAALKAKELENKNV